jgi:L-lactate dehydrogenase complex protein LldG
MPNSRFQIFERIRRSTKSGVLPAADHMAPAAARTPAFKPEDLVEPFVRELKSAGAKVLLPSSPREAVDIIIGLLRDSSSSRELLTWDDSEFPVAQLGPSLRKAGFELLDANLPADRKLRRVRLAELGRASAGLTSAQAGLADSGTLALLSGLRRPRLASLLPPLHIAILPIRAIYPSMAAYFQAHPKNVLQASNLVFITGPSRTADIEQNLTIGVHGPRELATIIVRD